MEKRHFNKEQCVYIKDESEFIQEFIHPDELPWASQSVPCTKDPQDRGETTAAEDKDILQAVHLP